MITEFDPFQLDPTDEYYGFDTPNVGVSTFNPAGLLALQLHNKQIDLGENVFIQTCIFPVRYEDFDKGIVEKTINKYFDNVDVIITTSRNNNNWDIECYAIAYRGGFHDNMNIGNSDSKYNSSKFIPNTSSEFTETTLPKNKIFGKESEIRIVSEKIRYDEDKTLTTGSGSNYLSNEIMYRTTKLRDSKGSNKPVGHFHIYLFDEISTNALVKQVTLGILKKIVE